MSVPNARVSRRSFALLTLVAAACSTTLEEGLSEEQANRVVVALAEAGVGASKARVEATGDAPRFAVDVAREDVGRALAVLRANDLPQRPEPGLAEVFGEPGLVPTSTEERARYAAALGAELAESLERMPGVLDARVHLALATRGDLALDDTATPVQASVLLKRRPRAIVDEPAVRALVAGAVEGLAPERVSVVSVEAEAARGAAAPLVRLGPIAVTAGSASALKGVLGASLALHFVLAAALVVVLRRRTARETTRTATPQAPGG